MINHALAQAAPAVCQGRLSLSKNKVRVPNLITYNTRFISTNLCTTYMTKTSKLKKGSISNEVRRFGTSSIKATNGPPKNFLHSAAINRSENKKTTHKHNHMSTDKQHTHTHDSSHTHESTHSHDHEDHGHSHGLFGHSHSHSQPNELLVTNAKSILSNPAVRITWIGLLVNVAMAISKGIGGVYFHSQSLVADAIHSVSDMVADFLTLATVNVASKVGTPINFPLGYGKIESVGSILVSGVLLFAGVSVGWSSLLQVFEYTLPSYIYDYVSAVQIGHSHSHGSLMSSSDDHSHSHSHMGDVQQAREVPNINAAWIAGGSIIVKELLFYNTLSVANATNSKVLVANAWHHRVDSLTSLVALITVTGGYLFNILWLDAVGGLCVSVLIIKAGWGTFVSSCNELVDRGEKPGSETYDKIDGIVAKELDSNTALKSFTMEKLSVMCAGANTNILVTLKTTESSFNLIELNNAEQQLKESIKKEDKFIRNIHIEFKHAVGSDNKE